MSIKEFIQPQNAGAQVWQMLWSNTTSGEHPYNFSGLCATLVAQWLLEIKFANGATPDELGRYLLKGDLGKHGYGGIASSQGIYGKHAPLMNNHTALFDRHSGGALQRQQQQASTSANAHWGHIHAGIYGAGPAGGHIGITGDHNWLLRQFGFTTWGHAIGVYNDTVRVFFFDPNYGVAIMNAGSGRDRAFVDEVWREYGVTNGRFSVVS
jgi:hypothetical protein